MRKVSFDSETAKYSMGYSENKAMYQAHPHRSAYTQLTHEEKTAYNLLANVSNAAKHYYLQVPSPHKAAYVQFVKNYKKFLTGLRSDEQAHYLERTIRQRFS